MGLWDDGKALLKHHGVVKGKSSRDPLSRRCFPRKLDVTERADYEISFAEGGGYVGHVLSSAKEASREQEFFEVLEGPYRAMTRCAPKIDPESVRYE